jgi:hypothetical protein
MSGKYEDDEASMVKKASKGLFMIVLFCCISGPMLLHIASFLLGASSLILFVVGVFIPPVGLINGLAYILTGDSVEQYY